MELCNEPVGWREGNCSVLDFKRQSMKSLMLTACFHTARAMGGHKPYCLGQAAELRSTYIVQAPSDDISLRTRLPNG